jgi:hypothetical protein
VSVEDSPDTDEEQVAASDGNEDGDDGDRAQDRVAIGEGSDLVGGEIQLSRCRACVTPLTDDCNSDNHESLGNQSVKIVSSL